jgi:uncharacterized protein YbcC (UPF0753/DUF2309 family)
MPISATAEAPASIEATSLDERVERAAACVAPAWPLHSFVTANPLTGFEAWHFEDAVREAGSLFAASGYPGPDVLRAARQRGDIDDVLLRCVLDQAGYAKSPKALLGWLKRKASSAPPASRVNGAEKRVNERLVKWLTVFLDEGQAEWPMPGREKGFYAAWRSLAIYDRQIPGREHLAGMPLSASAAIEWLIGDQTDLAQYELLRDQFAALPGWVGRIKQRIESDDAWQRDAPISLIDYAAVRLTLLYVMDEPLQARHDSSNDESEADRVAAGFERAWEQTYRDRLVSAIRASSEESEANNDDSPDAQWVFCIDTRSEVIRRHLEATGRHETFGFAGFFGLPMQYELDSADAAEPACPPILNPAHHIRDQVADGCETVGGRARQWHRLFRSGWRLVNDLKHNVGAAFHFVESSGPLYGIAMAARTLVPRKLRALRRRFGAHFPEPNHYCAPDLDGATACEDESLPVGLTHQQKVQYAAGALSLMGWDQFAPVVVFVGHGSESENNPFASSLHCGACAGHRGGPNARVLAAICNEREVRTDLKAQGFAIPEQTVFLAGEHNTTTDEIELFTKGTDLENTDRLQGIRQDLVTAQHGAASERGRALGTLGSSQAVRETGRRAGDWSEPRPEWGLAGNAAFVIGPRWLTRQLNLSGRCFLHSYDWQKDPDGSLLETICNGPMVVTQWINNHYYFATVDNAVFGSGSKVTQNPVGNIGVVQGNGGDLMTGLPLQSVAAGDDDAFHQPLRLTVVIHSPLGRVLEVFDKNQQLAQLVSNEWISVVALDPQEELTPRDVRQHLQDAALAVG